MKRACFRHVLLGSSIDGTEHEWQYGVQKVYRADVPGATARTIELTC